MNDSFILALFFIVVVSMIIIYMFKTVFITISKQNDYRNTYLFIENQDLVINTLFRSSYHLHTIGKVMILLKIHHNKMYGYIQIVKKDGKLSKKYHFDGGKSKEFGIRNTKRYLMEELNRYDIDYSIKEEYCDKEW